MREQNQSHVAIFAETQDPTSKKLGTETCEKCGGLLTGEFCIDTLSSDIGFSAIRCIQCGNLFDDVILTNRQYS